MIRAGHTFQITKLGKGQVAHLWIALFDPNSSGHTVCVNVTTRRETSDTTTILRPGDHPFIRHESVILYADARKMDVHKVWQVLILPYQVDHCLDVPCCAELLDRVRAGALISKYTPKEIKEECQRKMAALLQPRRK